jgi:hypothetical protein
VFVFQEQLGISFANRQIHIRKSGTGIPALRSTAQRDIQRRHPGKSLATGLDRRDSLLLADCA